MAGVATWTSALMLRGRIPPNMISPTLPGEITELLAQARAGEHGCLDQVFALLYPELRRLAHARTIDSTHQATALVHECYLRLVHSGGLGLEDRSHFMGTAARAMRSVLVDRHRAAHTDKRGGGQVELTLSAADEVDLGSGVDLLALDAALEALDQLDPAQRELVELHFFAGLELNEIAELRGVSDKTIGRHWQRARAFLRVQLSDG
jgi:RNA polymerase sigma factor (TIGR02999 family)